MTTIEAEAAERVDPAFRRDVLAGLSQPTKAIPARWFYDLRGSELFERITDLPEYYPTRTEIALLRRHAVDIAARVGRGRAVVEFGSGSSTKTPLLLAAIDPAAYVPIDISGDFLRASALQLGQTFPDLPIAPLEGDFTHTLSLPRAADLGPRLGFFPGSTIGNGSAASSVDLLRAMADTLGDDAMLLIGIDRRKSLSVLLPAYDDAAGVTAAFNLNLLHRINSELDGDIPVECFRHRVRWNDLHNRIEMHLEAQRDVDFTVARRRFSMRGGETIHTENSHKYSRDEALLLLRAGGWQLDADWADEAGWFGLYLARRVEHSVQD